MSMDAQSLFAPLTTEAFRQNCILNVKWLNGYQENLLRLIDFKLERYRSPSFARLMNPDPGDSESRKTRAQLDDRSPKMDPRLTDLIRIVEDHRKQASDISIVRGGLLQAVARLEELEGRDTFKQSLLDTLYGFQRNFRMFTMGYLSFAFFGGPGVGKSTLAMTTASFFRDSMLMAKSTIIHASRSNLVAGYIGQTAKKTRDLLINSLEGTIFVDEAYSLTPCSGDDAYGIEAVNEMVDFMSKYRCLHIVIIAGYRSQILNCFFAANEGLARRFSKHVQLADYTPKQLVSILEHMLTSNGIMDCCNTEIHKALTNLIDQLGHVKGALQNQAGDIENLAAVIAGTSVRCKKEGYQFAQGDIATDRMVLAEALRTYLENKNIKAHASRWNWHWGTLKR